MAVKPSYSLRLLSPQHFCMGCDLLIWKEEIKIHNSSQDLRA